MLVALLCAAIAISRFLTTRLFTSVCSSCRKLLSKVILKTRSAVSHSIVCGVNGTEFTLMTWINARLGQIPVITSNGSLVVPSSFFPRRLHGIL